MDIQAIYEEAKALLKGHFLLSSAKHSQFYLQSAKLLESPCLASKLCEELARIIKKEGLKIDSLCSPAIGGILAGYELARSLNKRFIFTERVAGQMQLRRGFEVKKAESFLIVEDIITTGGSALEAANIIEKLGGEVVGFAALANRGLCEVKNLNNKRQINAKLPANKPLFALGNFEFEVWDESDCPLCKKGSIAFKPGSKGNG